MMNNTKIGIQSYMASPKEQNQARQMLLGKNLMPYLNVSDTKLVSGQYRRFNKHHDQRGERNPYSVKNFEKNKEKL